MSRPRAAARRWTGLALLAGLTVGAQAMAASDHALLVSATILPRIACQQTGEADAQGLAPVSAPSAAVSENASFRCRGTDPSVTYRIRSESEGAGSGSATVLVVEP